MPDIEDSFDVRTPIKANIGKSDENFFNIKIRAKKQKNEYADELKSEKNSNPLGSVLSWQKRVYLRTWGCSHNNSDSEYMSGLLTKAGFTVTSSKDLADLWLLNSCTVKTPSENLLVNQIKDAQNNGKKVCVAGCVSQAAPNEPWLKDVSIVGVQQIDRIVEVVDETIKGNVVRLLSQRRKDNLPLNLPKMRRNEFIEILAINSGCLNNCTYCKTKMARGDLRSFDLDSLVEQARKAYEEENCKEVWLTSEDLGAWGRDIGHVLPDLLEELVKVIPEGCMMRLGMTNPPYILDYLEDMAKILNHPRVYSFLHIPVQSGSNAVLTDMKREYTVEQFAHIVDYMKEHVPDIYIATDFICAFPTENKEDFEESLALVKKYEFPSLFINQFYPRPGTPAARLRKVETTEAKERTKEMTKLFHSYRRYTDHRIGMQYEVLICEMATDGISYVGHNKSYEHILVAPPADCRSLLGQRVRVEIVETAKFYMKGAIVEAPPVHKTDVLADIKLDPYRTMPEHGKYIVLLALFIFLTKTSAKKSANDDSDYNCGMATTRMPEARVLNGMDVERGEWPWLAYISITTGDMTGSCTGTIISQRGKGRVKVIVGRISLNGTAGKGRSVAKVAIHPTVRKPGPDGNLKFNLGSDTAVLTLKKPLKFGPMIQKICLSSQYKENVGEIGFTAGWGYQQGAPSEDFHGTAQQTQFPFEKAEKCVEWAKRFDYSTKFLPEYFLCGGTYGRGTETGDSGGPVSTNFDGRWFQVGVTSYGEYQKNEKGRQFDVGAYARVSKACEFIEEESQGEARCLDMKKSPEISAN